MATLNFTFTYPDAAQTKLVNILKARYATNGNPTPSNAQAQEGLRLELAGVIKGFLLAVDQKAAVDAVVPTDVT